MQAEEVAAIAVASVVGGVMLTYGVVLLNKACCRTNSIPAEAEALV